MKHSLYYYARIYVLMLVQDFKSNLAYRADFFNSTAGMLATNFMGLISFWLIFRNIPSIEGFRYEELLFMYAYALLAASPMQLLFDNLWQLWICCENGDFIKYCFKPLNLYFYYVAEILDVKGFGQLIFAIIMMVYSWIKLAIPFTFVNVLMLIVSLFGASLVLIGIMTIASASAFVTIHGATIMQFMSRFREYARYPVTIFDGIFKFIFSYIIPIAFMAYYPAMFFLRPTDHPYMALLSPIVGVIMFILGYNVWMKGALHYAGTGS